MRTLPPIGPKDPEILARTAYGEASDQIDAARIGVISVVLNRATTGKWPGGRSIAGVCQAPMQFDCWNKGTADYDRTVKATSADPAYAACLGLALAAIQFRIADNTNGAVFYHDTSLAEPPKEWGAVRLTVQLGKLKFYAQAKS
jgi:spore germination cell wall hydrolase CwlJ-like protein